jgi:hypothetical protein
MSPQHLCKLELGADTVGAGDQDRFLVTTWRERKQAAKPPDTGNDFLASRGRNQWLDALDEFVASVDVDTGIFIGQILFGHR